MLFIMPAALPTILTKPAELYDLSKSCRVNDASYYPAVHPGCDKPCGALRLTMSLRSCKTYDGPAELTIVSIIAPLRVDVGSRL
jgi:hypothetical protein